MLAALALLASIGCGASNASDDAGTGGFRCNKPTIGQCLVETSAPASLLQTDEASCVDAGGTVSTSLSCPTEKLAGCCTFEAVGLPDPSVPGSAAVFETRQTCYYAGSSDAGGVKSECENWSTTPLKP